MTDEPYILFELAGTHYAVPSRFVRKIELIDHITPVPNGPPALEGVVFSTGNVIPALNLRTRFGMSRVEFNLRTRLIIVETGTRTVGLIVDTAREFLGIPAGSIQPPHEAITVLSGKYLEGIARLGDRLVLVVNIEELVNLTDAALNVAPSTPLQQPAV
jgi:purine-binding chemotaxis protein CheW